MSNITLGPQAPPTADPTRVEPSTQSGEVLAGRWTIDRVLRRGGHGVVYLARDQKLGNRTYALKALDPKLMVQGHMLERFRREVGVMQELSHRRILRVYHYDEEPDQDLAFIVMEYIAGGSLQELLATARRQGRLLHLFVSLRILVQGLEALMESHERGIIHRDVSPGNILLAGGPAEKLMDDALRDPLVKLADFGIAGLVEQRRRSEHSAKIGTGHYSAPEIEDEDQPITTAADIYSLGVLAWEMLTGRRPTIGSAHPSMLHPDAPPELDDLLREMMNYHEPEQRPLAWKARERAANILLKVSGGLLHSDPGMPDPTPVPGPSPVHIPPVVAAPAVGNSSPGTPLPTGVDTPPTVVAKRAVPWLVGLAVGVFLVFGLRTSSPESPRTIDSPAESPVVAAVPTSTPTPPAVDTPPTPPSREPGVYLATTVAAGTMLTVELLEAVSGDLPAGADRPLDFEHHLDGACVNRALERGDRLEWLHLDNSC